MCRNIIMEKKKQKNLTVCSCEVANATDSLVIFDAVDVIGSVGGFDVDGNGDTAGGGWW